MESRFWRTDAERTILDIWIPFWMNTVDATPHVSGSDVSPCSVGATCSLNWRSVVIPRNERARDRSDALPRIEASARPSMKSPRSSAATPLQAARKCFEFILEFGLLQAASATRIILARSPLRYGLASSSTPELR